MDRAGFIDAPQMGHANIASSAITEPTTMPAVMPRSFDPVETLRMTNIRMAVRTNSKMKDCDADPAGKVAPSVACAGKRTRINPLAANAPRSWLVM